MNEIALSELQNKIIDMDLLEALIQIIDSVPLDVDLKLLKGEILTNESDHQGGIQTDEVYNIRIRRSRKALFFFLKRLNHADFERVYKKFLGTPIVPDVTGQVKILFVASSPLNLDALQTNVEFDKIRQALAATDYRGDWILIPIMAGTIDSFAASLIANDPGLVHFSGHAGKNGIVLNNDKNNKQIISKEILKTIFSQAHAQCIFLNACYSAELARELSLYSKYVIGMNDPVGDETAIIFSTAFYSLLGNSKTRDFEKSFIYARAILRVKVKPEAGIPEIWKEGIKLELV